MLRRVVTITRDTSRQVVFFDSRLETCLVHKQALKLHKQALKRGDIIRLSHLQRNEFKGYGSLCISAKATSATTLDVVGHVSTADCPENAWKHEFQAGRTMTPIPQGSTRMPPAGSQEMGHDKPPEPPARAFACPRPRSTAYPYP